MISGEENRNLGVDIAHDMLDTGVILEAVIREILTVAASLEATMRHFSDDWNVGVNPDAAEVEGLGHAHGATMVAGPYR